MPKPDVTEKQPEAHVVEVIEQIELDSGNNRASLKDSPNGNGHAMGNAKLGGRQNSNGTVQMLNGKKPNRFKMQINQGYYTIDSRWRDFMYFFTLTWPHPLRAIWNRIRWHWDPRLRRVAKFPDHVDIEISGICNLHCPMCFRQTKFYNMNATHGLMDIDTYKKIIDECASHKIYSIKLSWRGESSLHPKTIEMIKYAKDAGIREVAFLTNGLTVTGEKFREMAKAGLDWISVSFDGLGETYEAIRAPSKYDEALQRLRDMRGVRDEMKSSKPKIRVQSIWSAIRDDPAAYKRVMLPIVDKMNFIPDVKHLELQDHCPEFVCGYPWQRLTVCWDGTVPLCIGDLKELYKLGKVPQQSLYDIWHGEAMQKARKLHSDYNRLELPCCAICHQGRKATHMQDGEVMPKKIGNIRV
jgi:Radical SAM superfamily/Iron-sulfur cluster-binding domain